MELVTPGTADVDALTELWLALARGQREYGSHLLPGRNRTQIRQTLLGHVVTDSVRGARVGDAFVGFVTFSLERGAFEQDVTRGLVHNLYVSPEYRGEGIGSALLAVAERELATRGVDVVSLEVMAENETAREFYRERGYDSHRITVEKRVETANIDRRKG